MLNPSDGQVPSCPSLDTVLRPDTDAFWLRPVRPVSTSIARQSSMLTRFNLSTGNSLNMAQLR